MGASASVSCGDKVVDRDEVLNVLKTKLDLLKEESQKEGIEDTPRGETAKAEVKRLRGMLKSALEDNIPLEKCLEELSKPQNNSARSDSSEEDGEDKRVPCSKCQRKFNPDRIEKHESVCKGPKTTKAKSDGDNSSNDGDAKNSERSEDGVPKWKKDRQSFKEQLKKDQQDKGKSGSETEAEILVPSSGDGAAPTETTEAPSDAPSA